MDYTRIIPIPQATCEIAAKEGNGECGAPVEWIAVDDHGIRMAICGKCLSDLLSDDFASGEWAIGLDAITTTEGDC